MTTHKQEFTTWPPKMVVCVGTVVLHGDRALFVRQAPGHSLAGQWSIPWGVVDPDEPPEQAALRETQEEAGIIAEIKGLLGVQNLRREGWIALVYLCRHLGGTPVSDGGRETDRAAYLSLAEMDALEEPIETWCDWIVRRVLRDKYQLILPEPENPYRPRLAFL